ncbi:uncharacterized protein ATC70_003965 [Mucor velutinosus]|uniref:Uncharacterized protein n=1 Tax=Mucor velutinosus TaxID=708070 RepID=A0AAN7D6P7_9FUNG|nr:hypothetical protein ATC70_003965 [Mucor velutinosus]
MSEAKVYTNVKNVRHVTAVQNKKTVYKNVVASPFILKWPNVHTDLGQTILTQLVKTLTPLGSYRKECKSIKKKDKKSASTAIPKPDLHDRVHVGINQVTRFMEAYIEKKQTSTQPVDKTPVIYICKREIKPLQLCQHLLYMAALAQIKIVPMPAEAESKMSQALGIKRACVVLAEIMENKEESLRLSAQEIPCIDAPWLTNALQQQPVVVYRSDATIKTLKTTGPPPKQKNQQKQQQLKRKNQEEQEATSKKIKV